MRTKLATALSLAAFLLVATAGTALMATFSVPSLTISSDPAASPGFPLSGQTNLKVTFDNTPMTAGQSFDWKTQCLESGVWVDCGGGQHVTSGPLTTKSGGQTNIYSFLSGIPASATQIRAVAYNVVGQPITINNVTITVT